MNHNTHSRHLLLTALLAVGLTLTACNPADLLGGNSASADDLDDTPVASPEPDTDDPADPAAPSEPSTPDPDPETASPDTNTPDSVADAYEKLDGLTVSVERSRAGYDRRLFKHWSDLDKDGCDTRQWVLITESLTDGQVDSRCQIVSGGTWYSTYDDKTFTDPSDLDIDHQIPLAEAWDSGADEWDAVRREQFANDTDNEYALIAVSASSNRSKSDQDPAEWLPPHTPYRCQYVIDWINVKHDWDLTVDETEKAALHSVLDNDCDNYTGPQTPTTPPAATAPAPTTTAEPSTSAPAGSEPECDPNYTGACVPDFATHGDVNCADIDGPVTVIGDDVHRLDADGNKSAC